MKTRRQFLKSSLTGMAVGWTLPSFLHQTALSMERTALGRAIQTTSGRDHPILVVLQLGGGNDGLNTVIPYNNDFYRRARPRLRIAPGSVIKLDDQLGLHPSMEGIRELIEEGEAAVVNGVGYPNPNRSHFRSMEIWHTASDSDKNKPYGWIGRYFDNTCSGRPDPATGIALNSTPPQAFNGPRPIGISMPNPKAYRFVGEETGGEFMVSEEMAGGSIGQIGSAAPVEDPTGNLDFLRRTAMDAEVSSEQVNRLATIRPNAHPYPNSRLASDLALVARLIAGGMPTRVYYVNHGGFDTHANQLNTHARLLGTFSRATEAFCRDLKKMGVADRVLTIAFSEFGRRVNENGSGGTDHGVAGPLFVFGGNTRGGLYGNYPDLDDLDRGDLKHNVDFRSVYATVLEKWLKTNPEPVLRREFPTLDFLG